MCGWIPGPKRALLTALDDDAATTGLLRRLLGGRNAEAALARATRQKAAS